MFITVSDLSQEEIDNINKTTIKLRFNVSGLTREVKSIDIIPVTKQQYDNVHAKVNERITKCSHT